MRPLCQRHHIIRLVLALALIAVQSSADQAAGGHPLKADSRTSTPAVVTGVVFQVDSGNLFSAFQDATGQLWQADFDFLGGNTEGTRNTISNTTDSDAGAAPMYATNRVGPSFLYDFGPINRLMPNETYNVTLFFTEIYWDQPNARLFTVSANNRTVVSKYDIYTAAGGRDAACNLTFPVTLGPLAQLELQFSGMRDNAAVAGIQVSGPMAPSFKIQSFLQNDIASASPARGKALLRIDSGRGVTAGNYMADNSDVWSYDKLYQGGGTERFTSVIKNATNPDSTVYDTNRVGGAFQYGFTPAQGIKPYTSYTVLLYTADLYWAKPGQRTFTVSANGVPVLTDYDVIAEAGGPLTAATAAFKVTADSQGVITLTWAATRDQAIVGGIELYPAERAPRSVPKAARAAPAPAPAPAPARAAESAALAPAPALEPFGLLAPATGVPKLSKYEPKGTRPSAPAPKYQPSGLGVLDLQAAAPGPRPLPYDSKAAGAPAPGPGYEGYGYGHGHYGQGYGGYGYRPGHYGQGYGGYGYGHTAGRYGL